MAIARYDPYTDSFVYEDSKTSNTATISLESFPKNIIQSNVVELSDDSINKIAEAVVQKLRAEKIEKPEPKYVTHTAYGCNYGKWKENDEKTCYKCQHYKDGLGCMNREMYHTERSE